MTYTATENKSFYFQWHFLNRCNLRCQHCYQNDYKEKELEEKSLLRVAGILEAAMKQWQLVGRISLTGGEPFLDPALLFKLMDFFEASAFFNRIGILTNGTLLDRSIADMLAKYPKLFEVQVSLDGASQEVHDSIRGKGSFEKSLKGIACLHQSDISTAIMFTLTRNNASSVIEMIDLALELGIGAITIERATPAGPRCEAEDLVDPESLRNIYHAIAERKKEVEKTSNLKIRTSRPLWRLIDKNLGGLCPTGLSCLCILHDGTVLPCRRIEIPLGNILTDGLYKIWYTSELLWKIRDKKQLASGCRDCNHLGSCGGCRAVAYAITGDVMAKDPQCWLSDSNATVGGRFHV